MLRDVAWREVVDSWGEEAGSGVTLNKLLGVRKLMEKECKVWCVEVKCTRSRILSKLENCKVGS